MGEDVSKQLTVDNGQLTMKNKLRLWTFDIDKKVFRVSGAEFGVPCFELKNYRSAFQLNAICYWLFNSTHN